MRVIVESQKLLLKNFIFRYSSPWDITIQKRRKQGSLYLTLTFKIKIICRHEDRDKALNLCSWNFDKESTSLNKFLEQLESNHAYTRAAAIAVFNLKIKLAIDVLSRNSDQTVHGANLNVVAMALAGFSDEKGSVWKHFCSTSKAKLGDPYLKAMFSFLTAENGNYDNVLVRDTGGNGESYELKCN